MKAYIKRALKGALLRSSEFVGIERNAILLGAIRAEQIRQMPKLASLADAEFGVFSQWGEDGIISWLVDQIQPASKKFVEFGVHEFREANCRYLMMTRNWSGLVIDGGESNISVIRGDTNSYKYDLTSVCAFIKKDNISSLIDGNGYGGPIGLLSVDIDGVDYWVLESIGNDADIVIVEYNDLFSGRAVTVPYDEEFYRYDKHWSGLYWGASLDAFRHLLEGRGYKFAGTNSVGTNAFFVANRHSKVLESKLESFVSWPCKMRETRNKDGSLALKTYRDMHSEIADLPLVDVTTGKTITVREVTG